MKDGLVVIDDQSLDTQLNLATDFSGSLKYLCGQEVTVADEFVEVSCHSLTGRYNPYIGTRTSKTQTSHMGVQTELHVLTPGRCSPHVKSAVSTTYGFSAMLPLFKLEENDGGFLVNGQVMIVAALDVFEVIGTFDDNAAEPSLMIHSRKPHL
ncbi:hypothetical protein Bca4012_099821 [Brassica carinata]